MDEKAADPEYQVKRPRWNKSWDFMFAVVGCSIGLGNVWRFPYLCFKYGGGAFLIPYLFFAVFLGIPLVILETSLGQLLQGGLMKSWGVVPIFKGISLAALVTMFYCNTYYPILLVWAFKYLITSFQSTLPWSHCGNVWNSADCVTPNSNLTSQNLTRSNTSISAAEEFWNREVLGVSSGIENVGSLRGDLVLYLAILWVGIYFSTFKGIKWTAKVVYVTATLPFLLIFMILIRGVTLDGASEGIKYYLYPNATKLIDPEVWVSAGSQVFFSYAVSFGILVVLGSYNDIKHNFWRNSIFIGALNSITSFTSGFAVFSTLGFMAKYQNTTVDKVAQSGPGLAFIVYPETLSLLPLPQFWCVIFFLTLMSLGFDSQFVYQECFVGTMLDNFPDLRKHKYCREVLQAIFAVFMFILGLPMLTEGGVYVFEMFNNYAVAGWCMFFIGCCEFVAIGWLYGTDRYWEAMTSAIGHIRGKLWIKLSWMFIAPTICVLVIVYSLAGVSPLKYGVYTYPAWAQVMAHMMSLSSVGMIPAYAIYKVITTLRNGGSMKELCRRPFDVKPTPEEGEMMKPMI